jgi:hypothetical protein
VFENGFIRRIFEPKGDEVKGEWRRLHSEELHNLYSSPNIVRQFMSRILRWVWHAACMGEERKCTRFWWENSKKFSLMPLNS